VKDVHEIYTVFKAEFPELSKSIDAAGRAVHEAGGPLDERTRALLKIAMAAAGGHQRALETHLTAARQAGVTEDEIKHALLLLFHTCGFPTLMEAYSTYKGA
jgi:AhpD family alkylhydroperoxidase